MQAALNHELGAARVDGLLNFLQNFFVRQKVRALLIGSAEECAKFAFVLADVGIVYVSVNDEGCHVAEHFLAYGVRRLAQLQKVAAGEKFQCLVLRKSQNDSPRSKKIPPNFREG